MNSPKGKLFLAIWYCDKIKKCTYLSVYELPIPSIQSIQFSDIGRSIDLLRADLVHPDFGGNKFYKLYYNLQEAKHSGLPLLTFAGAHSNHLVAVAAASKVFGISAIGIVRGDELHSRSSPELIYAAEQDMQLHFISRADYRRRYDLDFQHELQHRFGAFFLLPEGGTNAAAVHGCMHLLSEQTAQYNHIFCATGTGGTVAGLRAGAKEEQQITAIMVVNDLINVRQRVYDMLLYYPNSNAINFNTDYTFGGYAKSSPDLLQFMRKFCQETVVPLDHVYTGKLLYAVYDLLKKGQLEGQQILVVHSGGYRFSASQF